ncbi:MAG: hypothetical protein AAGC96_01910 [Pseudomonadota bacterium]
MITLDYKPTNREIADWTRRCDALAAELKRLPFPPDEHWLREFFVRHTSPSAQAGRVLQEGDPVDQMLAEATADTDNHVRDMAEHPEHRTEIEFIQLRSMMRRCLAAMDAWLLHHHK